MDHGYMVNILESAPELAAQPAVQFDSDDLATATRQFSRQDSVSRADLDHHVPTGDVGLGD